jgi:hypothetical protein
MNNVLLSALVTPLVTLTLLGSGVFVIWRLCRLILAKPETAAKVAARQNERFLRMLSEIRDRIGRRNDQ